MNSGLGEKRSRIRGQAGFLGALVLVLAAVFATAAAPGLAEISVERVAEELLRILTGPRAGAAMRLMGELGLWPHVLPEIEAMKGVEQPANFHPEGDVFAHTALVLDKLAEAWDGEPPPALALAACALLVRPRPDPVAEEEREVQKHTPPDRHEPSF